MATVTGFTAARMLEIENSTVVDGEIQGDNLVLLTRDDTPINAGNVRGPQGIQGIPGPVPSVNNQTGAVIAPRIFANKAAIESQWPTAPNGAVAATTDAPGYLYLRRAGVWIVPYGTGHQGGVLINADPIQVPPGGSFPNVLSVPNSGIWPGGMRSVTLQGRLRIQSDTSNVYGHVTIRLGASGTNWLLNFWCPAGGVAVMIPISEIAQMDLTGFPITVDMSNIVGGNWYRLDWMLVVADLGPFG